MTSRTRTTTVHATPGEVWSVLADFGEISAWVPSVDHSCLLSEQTEGVGTRRRVQVGRQTVVEVVTTWNPPTDLAYSIDGLPAIVGAVVNSWKITAADTGGASIALTTQIDTGLNPIKGLIARLALRRMAGVSEQLLAGLAASVDPAAKRRDPQR